MTKKEGKDSDIAVEEKPKSKIDKGKIQRLPLGVKEDDYGYYVERVSPRNGKTQIKMEVIFDEDGARGRARANQQDCIYYDEPSGHFLYRGVKLVTPGMGPRPPVPDGLYTESYPGWDPTKQRGRPLAGKTAGSTGHGTRTDLMPVEASDKEERSREEKIASAAMPVERKEDED